ncbi:hypothetical protein RHS03_00214, partial [Rhizoctonia solani]
MFIRSTTGCQRCKNMRKKCDEKKPEWFKSRTIPGPRSRSDPDQDNQPLIEGEPIGQSLSASPLSIFEEPVALGIDKFDGPELAHAETTTPWPLGTLGFMHLPPSALNEQLTSAIKFSYHTYTHQQPGPVRSITDLGVFGDNPGVSCPVFDYSISMEEDENEEIDVEGVRSIVYARWIPIVLFDPLKVVHKAKQLVLDQFALSTASRTRVLLVARLVRTLARKWTLDEEGIVELEMLQDNIFKNLIGCHIQYPSSDETRKQAHNALGNMLEFMSIQITTSPLSSTFRLFATAAPVFLAACPPPHPPHLPDVLLNASLDLRHFAAVDVMLSVVTGRATFCGYYIPWSLEMSERLLERLDNRGVEWLLGIPDQFVLLLAYMTGLRDNIQERVSEYTDGNLSYGQESRLWTGAIDSTIAEKLEDDLGKIRILPCRGEEPALKLTRTVIRECWREVVYIYFYMGLCGANAQDPRVEYVQKKYMRLVNGIQPGRHPDMFLIFPMVIAGLATTKPKDRRSIVSRIIGLPEHARPGTLGNDLVKILEIIWARTATERRPACWGDLSTACQVVTGM